MEYEELKELYDKIYKKLFATLYELQQTNPKPELKASLQTELEMCYDLIGDTLDDCWWPQIEAALK